MDETRQFDLGAWQPLTFGGIAKFAHAKTSRLAVVILLFASVNGAVLGWFLHSVWSPVITEAILELPDKGGIHNGVLDFAFPPRILAHRPSLAIAMDLDKADTIGQIADVQANFHRTSFRMETFLGFMEFPYPTEWDVSLNKPELQPLWGAWRPFLIILIGAGFALALLFVWVVLGLIYTPLALVGSWIWKHPLNWRQAWRLSIAALMPGALWMPVVIFLYGMHQLSFVGLLVAFLLHIVAGWFFLLFSPACLKSPSPDSQTASESFASPFNPKPAMKSDSGPVKKNPFG